MDAIQKLQALGFTEYEARAYLALVDSGELNGYELAKGSGIPRANIYAVAEKLIQRGAAQRLSTADGKRYTAIQPNELLRAIETRQKRSLTAARDALEQRTAPRSSSPVTSLKGDELQSRARQLIDTAQTTLKIAIQPAEAARLAAPLRDARERGVNITTLCLEACEPLCGGCQGEIHCHSMAPEDGTRWLIVVADERTALVGQLDDDNGEGMATIQTLVVKLASAYIQQSLTLAMFGSELAGRFEGLLSHEAQQLLARLYPEPDSPFSPRPGHATPFRNGGARTS